MISSCDFSHILPGTFVLMLSYAWVFAFAYAVVTIGVFFGIRKNFKSFTGIVPDVVISLFWPVSFVAMITSSLISLFQRK